MVVSDYAVVLVNTDIAPFSSRDTGPNEEIPITQIVSLSLYVTRGRDDFISEARVAYHAWAGAAISCHP